MPGNRLYLDEPQGWPAYRFVRPTGTPGVTPGLRLVTYAKLAGQLVANPDPRDYLITKCVVDTGSPISIISQDLWSRFRPGVVTPLRFDPATPPHHRRIVIAGGTFPFELGEIPVRLEDRDRKHLDVTVVAMFTRDGGRLPIPLTLGLRGGVLDGRVLRAEPDPAAPFGQAWAFEDPPTRP